MTRTAAVLAALLLGVARTAGAQGSAPARSVPRLTKAPRLTSFVEAPYPESEKAAQRTATVVLRVGIGATGSVEQVAIVESAGAAFDAAAEAAVRRFVFEPAEIDGKPAAIRILYRYEFVFRPEAPTTAILTGQVVNGKTKKPLPGVVVEVDAVAHATTDADGRFSFEALSPGAHAIALSGEHLTRLETTESLEVGKKLAVTYTVEPQDPAKPADEQDDLEVVVTPPALAKQAVSTEVAADEARRVPGTQGDVLKVVENLPGVARPSIGSGQIVVWGAAPEDTRVYLDGVPLPTLYHQGGFRSVVHSDMVQSVELVPGGWGADYGRGIGGLLDVKLRPLDQTGVHGSASADLLDASADVRARLPHDVSVEVAGRKSYLDGLLPLFTSRNIGAYIPIPRYYDGEARVVWDIAPGESLELGGLLSSDAVDDSVPSEDPTNVQTQTHDTSFQRVWVKWKKTSSDGAEISVVPSVGANSDSLVDQFGSVPTHLDVTALLASLRASWRKRVMPWLTVTTGIDAQITKSDFDRTGSNTSPPRPGDPYVFGEAPTDEVAHDDGTSVAASVAPYLIGDFALLDDRLHLVPGVRVEPYVLTASRTEPAVGTTPPVGLFQEFSVAEPRLAARWSPLPWITWKAAWGLYHQPPAPADLSAVFGNPNLGLETAEHLLGGVAVGTPDIVSVEATAFRVTSQGLAVRSPLPSPLLAESLVPTGIGRTVGVQLLVKKRVAKKLFGWVTYTLSRAQRANAENAPFYPYDYDQTNVLTAVASYDFGHGFEVGSRFRYTTGYPRTPVTGAYFDVKTGTYEPLFGALNSIRIPDFIQLDLRVSKRFALGRGVELETYLDVQNVTDRSNPEEIVYSLDYTQRRYITGLPILPVLGARLSW
jgi:TonB family protein